jgi:cob(I)alamin adenosyltransferase
VKIYTKTGDQGETSLFGGGRVSKTHPRIEAYGTLDELNAYLGWFGARNEHEDLVSLTRSIQAMLFDLGARLATPPEAEKAQAVLPPIPGSATDDLEAAIDRLENELEPLTSFVLPGGAEDAALLHVARSVARRAEREVVRAGSESQPALPPEGFAYLNRLSDLLFVMARAVNRRASVEEPIWSPERPQV